MYRFSWWLVAVTALALVFAGGCGNKTGEATVPPVAAASPGPAPASPAAPTPPGAAARGGRGPAPTAVALTGDLAKIESARQQVKSYEVTISGGPARPGGRPMSMTSEVKFVDGQPVRKRMTTRDGYRLILLDQRTSYNVNATAKTATRFTMPAPGGARGGSRGGGRGLGGGFFDPAGATRNATTSSVSLDGVDCYLVQWKNNRGEQMQVWVDKRYGLERKSQSARGTMTFTYRKINSVPASDFELPAGLKITEAPAGGRGGGRRPAAAGGGDGSF